MSDEFYESLGNIKTESMEMIKNLRAIRGEHYARMVHSIILAGQIERTTEVMCELTNDQILANALSHMSAKIMDYYMRSSGLSDAELKQAFADAQRITAHAYELVDKASTLAKQGHVMGGE